MADLAKVVYDEIINIMFVVRVSKGQEVMERGEIASMVFGTSEVAAKDRKLAWDCLKELCSDKKIEQVGGRLNLFNYRLTDDVWVELVQ